MTHNLQQRVNVHKQKLNTGFTRKYNIDRLVYFEEYNEVLEAIAREKQLKKWSRVKKDRLIEGMNPQWEDLAATR